MGTTPAGRAGHDSRARKWCTALHGPRPTRRVQDQEIVQKVLPLRDRAVGKQVLGATGHRDPHSHARAVPRAQSGHH